MTAGSCLQLAKSGRPAIMVGTTRLPGGDPYGAERVPEEERREYADRCPLQLQVMRRKYRGYGDIKGYIKEKDLRVSSG
jgi:hypothetical protein